MGIEALPPSTIRVLGASQVLTDPAAVVKELLDNAYDANATSISVEIHSNTIDIIQIRDNGHGIGPEDRALVARRYCTSKISHDDDLKDIGASSLGFRGEALASAAELSGSLTISTKIEGEQVAAALKVNQQGEVQSQDKASLPVGTTVRITDFIKNNPVRRQIVLKNTETCLKKIKHTLQAYAFARPHVRLSLRVLKAKSNKYDWVYAPKTGGNAEDAAFKIIGAACASQCTWSVFESGGFTFQAFLPRADADVGKIIGIGAFISVDRRPVSAVKGIFKQITKTFRDAFKSTGNDAAAVKDPFFYLEILCPHGSYDVNMEPAKDDLLFDDSAAVKANASRLFSTAYDQQDYSNNRSATVNLLAPSPQENQNGKARNVHSTHIEKRQMTSLDREGGPDKDDAPATRAPYRSTMYGCDEEDLGAYHQRTSPSHAETAYDELRQSRNDITVSNPWVAAKLNASLRNPSTVREMQPSLPERTDLVSAMPPIMSSPPSKRLSSRDIGSLPTPRPSSPSPNEGFHPSHHVPDIRLARDGRIVALSGSPRSLSPRSRALLATHCSPQYDHISSANPMSSIPLQLYQDNASQPRRTPRKSAARGKLSRPFKSPMIDGTPHENVWFDHLQQPRPQRRKSQGPTQHQNDGLVTRGELPDLSDEARTLPPPPRSRDIRDYIGADTGHSISSMIENRHTRSPLVTREGLGLSADEREERSRQQQRGFIPASEVMMHDHAEAALQSEPLKQPAKRRRTSERRALRELSTNAPMALQTAENETTDEASHSPTGKRTSSRRKSSTKLGRTKSSRLPLERTPAGQGTHGLELSHCTSAQRLKSLAEKTDLRASMLGYDDPAMPEAKGIIAASSHVLSLTAKLHQLLVSVGGEGTKRSPERLLAEVKAGFARRTMANEPAEDDEMLMSMST